MRFWTVRTIVWVLLRILLSWVGGIRFEGRENVPRKGGVLVTPNHFSDGDPPVIGFALPRACYFMAKEELFAMKFWGKVIVWLHGFPIKRYSADRAALKRAEQLLKAGEAVVIFPEGKLSEDAKLQPFLPGVLLIAQHAQAPILPVAMLRVNEMMPYGELKPRRIGKRLIIRFGKPVTAEELTGGLRGGAGYEKGAERLRQLVQALLDDKPYPALEPLVSDQPSIEAKAEE